MLVLFWWLSISLRLFPPKLKKVQGLSPVFMYSKTVGKIDYFTDNNTNNNLQL